ncbi:VanZ family protein [Clostridium estertheticum]|uniref:VanZ family protein n=1 Tax=Clostridium estertheticum TaxID=238834 RepID=UPI001CF4CDE7|nr:VanZ family protein [Clostridium estertheticum]MCB2362175.1 VanZ family protein [Clostridium estertheticum]
MLISYLREGIGTFIYLIPIAFIVFSIFIGGKFLTKRPIEFKPLSMLCEFAWILVVITILKITGIIGGEFSTTAIFNDRVNYSFALFGEGLSMATLLNIALFTPFGFFSSIVLKKFKNKWIYGILIGLIFSGTIEFLQIFTGRFVQLNDILMNTLGTFIGYEIWFMLLKINLKLKQKS